MSVLKNLSAAQHTALDIAEANGAVFVGTNRFSGALVRVGKNTLSALVRMGFLFAKRSAGVSDTMYTLKKTCVCGAQDGGGHHGIADAHGIGKTGFCPNDPLRLKDILERNR